MNTSKTQRKLSNKDTLVANLNALAAEINRVGLQEIDIEDGELSFILRKAAEVIEQFATDNLQ